MISDITQNQKFTSIDLTTRITAHISELAKATDAARVSEEMLRYLETCSKFHQYSLYNQWQILMTRPDATAVAGFRKWQSLCRYVRKGERGIPILAPIITSRSEEKDDNKKMVIVVGFKIVYVFDISQTEGEPLPSPPDWKSPEKNKELTDRLNQFANRLGISVIEKVLRGEVQGISKGGSIELSPLAGTMTLVHELAHEMLHHQDTRPVSKAIKELEAEAVAFVVARHFGLEVGTSPNYIALYQVDSKCIFEHLECIRSTATCIISSINDSKLDESSE
jgi:hypothetical protein